MNGRLFSNGFSIACVSLLEFGSWLAGLEGEKIYTNCAFDLNKSLIMTSIKQSIK